MTTLYPADGWAVTDIALSFSWNRPNRHAERPQQRWITDRFRIQVATEPTFLNPVVNTIRHAVGHDTGGFDPNEAYPKEMLDHWREAMWMPAELLAPGDDYWRIRVADAPGGPWTDPIGFTVVPSDEPVAPVRPLGPDAPLFSFDMYGSDSNDWGDTAGHGLGHRPRRHPAQRRPGGAARVLGNGPGHRRPRRHL